MAAYFALEPLPKPMKDCAQVPVSKEDPNSVLWAMNIDWAAKASGKLLRKARKNRLDQVKLFLEGPIELNHSRCFFDVFLKEPPIDCAYPLTPFRVNQRLTIQKGLFLIPGNVSESFKTNLMNLPEYQTEEKFLKIVLPSKLRKEILGRLLQMNISHATLFPDLDGFAKSLAVYNHYMEKRLLDKYWRKWKWPVPKSQHAKA